VAVVAGVLISFFFQAVDGIRFVERSRGLGDEEKREVEMVVMVDFLLEVAEVVALE